MVEIVERWVKRKRDAKHIFCIDFHFLMEYFIGQKQKKYDWWASSKKVYSTFFVE
jgi:hypothetical protein